MSNSFKRFIQQTIKHSVISNKTRKAFGSIGASSEIYRPLLMDKNLSNVFIGEETTILKGLRLQSYPVDDIKPVIKIGNKCYFGFNLSILAGKNITIGNNVLFASNILITSEAHGIDPESEIPYMDQKLSGKEVSIGDNVWIGEKVCILPGVRIGSNSIIGAGSIVTKSVPDYSIAVGNPAHIIKRYNIEEHSWYRI